MKEPPYFLYCPQCKNLLLQPHEEDAMQYCKKCDWKFYFHTPQTAAAIVENAKQEVLLVRRRNEPFKGKWSLPAGFVKYGEKPINAALRELYEETKLTGEYDHIIGMYIADDDKRTYSLLTIIKVKNITGKQQVGDDADNISFFPLTDLPEIAFKAHSEALKSLSK